MKIRVITLNGILVSTSLIVVVVFEFCALKEALTLHTSEAWKNASSGLLLLTPSILRLQDRDPDRESSSDKNSNNK